ncbi:MAG: indolepyruvate ferredoxin oxidoreductase subunit alpha [candidate division WOR-3 bacterium]
MEIAKTLLSGDEAIARGAWEAGCKVAAAYPGTPSTQILENLANYQDVYCEWSTNEKVALEVALGAALAGVRSLCAMKHVGLNVAADPLFSSAYIGVNAGMVIVTADDPGLHSSQNEQDNRYYGMFAKIPVLTPSDSQEAKDFTKLAFEISEQFDIPVILRITTRIAHSKTVVELQQRAEIADKGYTKNVAKMNLLPQFARKLHANLEERIKKLEAYANNCSINKIIEGKKNVGVIADGVAFQYAREVFPKASFLKLGMVWPFPKALVKEFCRNKKHLYVIEEVDPFLETQIKALGIKVIGKDKLPLIDELNPRIIRNALTEKKINVQPETTLPARPPALCPGCPHAGLFYLLQKKDIIITGDIGCYTLGTYPPHNAMDSCVCMGASITLAHGIEKALKYSKKENDQPTKRVVSVIGDSTFFHMGITGLINTIYNKGNQITVIVDNRTTGMTGHQDHPGTGKTLMGEETIMLNTEDIAKACGVKKVYVIDPYNIKENRTLFRQILADPDPAVIVSKRTCALLVSRKPAKKVLADNCIGCKLCLALGCPAISFVNDKAVINSAFCVGCGMCVQLCAKQAIV